MIVPPLARMMMGTDPKGNINRFDWGSCHTGQHLLEALVFVMLLIKKVLKYG